MAIQWSAISGHLRVGIDVRTSSYTTDSTAITVYVDYYVKVENWRYNDSQNLYWNAHYVSGNQAYTNSQGSTGTYTYLIHTQSYSHSIYYGGGPTLTFKANVSGAYDGSAPSIAINWTVPARPANVPTAPSVSSDSVTASSARVVVGAADGRGATVLEYQTQVDNHIAFDSIHESWSGGTKTVSGLPAASTFFFRSRARNSVGWGAWSSIGQFTTGASAPGAPTGLASSAITETDATLSWTAPGSTGGSAIQHYDVQRSENSSFSSGVVTSTSSASPFTTDSLTPGKAYWYRVRAVNGVGAGAWSNTVSFTTLTGTPTVISPSANQALSTGYAAATISAIGIGADREITVEFSKSATFASGITTLTQTPSSASANNQYTLSDTTKALSNGTWYVRAKVRNTSTNYTTPWSSTVTFTQSHVPAAVLQSPTADSIAKYSATTPFTWTFTDPATVDYQTSYRLVVEDNLSGDLIYDSGKTALSSTTNQTYLQTVAIASTYKGSQLRWRMKVWDRDDQESLWSGYALFRLSDPPSVTIVTPAPGLDVDTGAPTFSWTTSIPSGGTQAQAVVVITDATTNEVTWNTTVTGTATSVTPNRIILANAKSYLMELTVTDSVGLSTTVTSSFTTSYDAPTAVNYEIFTVLADLEGAVVINWDMAAPDAYFVSWKVYRREQGEAEWTLLEEITDQNVRSYEDYMLQSGRVYQYSVTQTAMRFGVKLESTVGYRHTGETEVAETGLHTIQLGYYWLIDPDSPSDSVRLPNVTSDPVTLEFEEETYTIIGRGRHRDYGDELGYSGTLTCQVRTPESQSAFRTKIENLRRRQETYYLRTPYGRLFPVALGNIGWTPIAGTGNMEMGDLTVPYEQVS